MSKVADSREAETKVAPDPLNFVDEEKAYRRALEATPESAEAMSDALAAKPESAEAMSEAPEETPQSLEIAPHSLEVAAKWAVMTRLEPTSLADDASLDLETRALLKTLTPISKAMIYAGRVPPTFSDQERKRVTKPLRALLRQEHQDEGRNGIGQEKMLKLLGGWCEAEKDGCLTPEQVFEGLGSFVKQDLPTREAAGLWFDFEGFLTLLRGDYESSLREEIEQALVDLDLAEIEARIRKYLRHVKAFNKSEEIRNFVKGTSEAPDQAMMCAIEEAIGVLPSEAEAYRIEVLGRASSALAAGRSINIYELYRDVFLGIEEMLSQEQLAGVCWATIEEALAPSPTREDFERLVYGPRLDDFAAALRLMGNLEGSYCYGYRSARKVVLNFVRNILPAASES